MSAWRLTGWIVIVLAGLLVVPHVQTEKPTRKRAVLTVVIALSV